MLGDIGKQNLKARSRESRDNPHQYLMVSFLFLVFAIVCWIFAVVIVHFYACEIEILILAVQLSPHVEVAVHIEFGISLGELWVNGRQVYLDRPPHGKVAEWWIGWFIGSGVMFLPFLPTKFKPVEYL